MPEAKQQARLKADSHLFRITPEGAGFRVEDSLALTAAIRGAPALADHADAPLDANGVTIEGIAVAGPSTFVRFPRRPERGGGWRRGARRDLLPLRRTPRSRPPAPPRARAGAGFATLPSPTADPAARRAWSRHPRRSRRLRPLPLGPATGDEVQLVADLPSDGSLPGKLEAILPLGISGQELRLLTMFDGPDEGAPGVCPVPWLP